MNLAQSLLSVEKPEGRRYSVTSALTDGICKGPGAQRRELSASLLSVEAGKGPGAIQSSSPFYRGEIDANSLLVLEPGLGFRTTRDRRRLGKGWGNRKVGHHWSSSSCLFAFLPSWTSCYGAPSHQASCSGDQWLSPRSRGAGNQPCPAKLPLFTAPWHTFSPSHPLSEPSLGPRTTSVPSI